jgi:hypothetical protein
VDEERHINNRFVGVLCRNSDPAPDPPRTQFFRWQNPSLNKMKKISFRDYGHVITSKWKLAIGIDGWNDRSNGALSLPLGSHRNLLVGTSGLKNSEKWRSGRGKVRVRARNSKRHVGMSINGLLRSGITSKMLDHSSEK